jgi:hypothetical protein
MGAVLFLTAAPAWGWGDKGHVTVATIAQAHLCQASKSAILELLGTQRLSDPRTATWADHIRPLDAFREIYPHNDQWHFIDTPVAQQVIDLMRDGKDGNNVIAKVGDFQKILADAGQDKQKRRDALRFIVHFVGDMHQPLHCIDRDDRGGNKIHISINGRPQRESNLHSFWDTTLVTMAMKDMEVSDFSARLDADISVAKKKEWQKGTPLDWAIESHRIAIAKGYTLRGKELPVGEVVDLDNAYIETAQAAVVEQLQKAGIRLAQVLNDTFAAP